MSNDQELAATRANAAASTPATPARPAADARALVPRVDVLEDDAGITLLGQATPQHGPGQLTRPGRRHRRGRPRVPRQRSA
jgi:hypothetical protein